MSWNSFWSPQIQRSACLCLPSDILMQQAFVYVKNQGGMYTD